MRAISFGWRVRSRGSGQRGACVSRVLQGRSRGRIRPEKMLRGMLEMHFAYAPRVRRGVRDLRPVL